MKAENQKNYAIPAMVEFIKDKWSEEINNRLSEIGSTNDSGSFDIFDFPLSLVKIELMDSSVVEFCNSYYIISGKKRAIAVITEHCGYHVFPIHEAKIFSNGILVYSQSGSNYP